MELLILTFAWIGSGLIGSILMLEYAYRRQGMAVTADDILFGLFIAVVAGPVNLIVGLVNLIVGLVNLIVGLVNFAMWPVFALWKRSRANFKGKHQ